jgi:Arf-GAP/Rho-GAP domain/ANK repeat/PH domain-containing protein 1
MLSRRKLIFYDYIDAKLEILDLRKARYIGWKDSDESINQLLVEKSSTIFVDCPPFTCYFVMMSERETKNWNLVIRDEAYANGSQLCHQQLTKDNVPVIIDKCINFVYTHGELTGRRLLVIGYV